MAKLISEFVLSQQKPRVPLPAHGALSLFFSLQTISRKQRDHGNAHRGKHHRIDNEKQDEDDLHRHGKESLQLVLIISILLKIPFLFQKVKSGCTPDRHHEGRSHRAECDGKHRKQDRHNNTQHQNNTAAGQCYFLLSRTESPASSDARYPLHIPRWCGPKRTFRNERC